MEWLQEHWMAIAVILVVSWIGWSMGRHDGLTDADKRDGTLRQDADGWVWVFDDGEWKQLLITIDSIEHGARIEHLKGMTVTPFTRKELDALPEGRKTARAPRILNESFEEV